MAYTAPATPAIIPDTTKAPRRVRVVDTPAAAAARGLSRVATQMRPVRPRRRPTTTTTVATRTPRQR